MISVNDFRTGATIEVDGDIWRVIEFQHVKPGKGAAFVRSKLRNLRSGNINEKTFRAGEKVKRAQIDNLHMQYLYANGDDHVFMNNETYDQIEIPGNQIEYELKFLKGKYGSPCDSIPGRNSRRSTSNYSRTKSSRN